jgi:hypothetical protein
MGVGIHIVFGRLNANEMKYYEALAGMDKKETELLSYNTASELDENYQISHQRRTQVQDVNTLDGYKMRIRDFQEVSVFMIQGGRVLKGFIAKVKFPAKTEFKKKDVPHIDFTQFADYDVNELHPKVEANESGKEQAEKRSTSIRNETVRDEDDGIRTLPVLPDIETPNIDAQRATIPDDINDITRKRKGIAEMLRDNANDTSIFDITAQHAMEIAAEREAEIEERQREENRHVDPSAVAYERRTRGYRERRAVERVDAPQEEVSAPAEPQQRINFRSYGQRSFTDILDGVPAEDELIEEEMPISEELLTEEEQLDRELAALNSERRAE